MIDERQGNFTWLNVGGKSFEVSLCGSSSAQHTIVLLHEALGSVSYWKDFPDKLAAATACQVLAYSRAGHGNSQGPLEPRSVAYYRNQVDVILPALLEQFCVRSPILYGHSEGAGIALLYAAEQQHNVRAVIAEAPIVTPEARSRERIGELAAAYPSSELSRKLARYHRDADAVFQSWIAGVTTPQMLQFPLDRYLPKIVCPILVLQGADDEFGGAVQLQTIQKYLTHAQCEVLAGAGHLLHRERTELVLEKVRAFLVNLPSSSREDQAVFHTPRSVPE